MSITIRECGHSAETASRGYKTAPDVCVSCEYSKMHPAKPLYEANRDSLKRARQAEHMRNVWKARKGHQGPRIEDIDI